MRGPLGRSDRREPVDIVVAVVVVVGHHRPETVRKHESLGLVDAARQRLESGDTQLKRVARLTGLGDEQNLRRAFRRVLRITPQEYRERFCRS